MPRPLEILRVRPAAAARRRWNGVSVAPGHTALTRTPCLASSKASVLVSDTMPALVTSYWPIPARGLTAWVDEMLTMLPRPLARRSPMAARMNAA